MVPRNSRIFGVLSSVEVYINSQKAPSKHSHLSISTYIHISKNKQSRNQLKFQIFQRQTSICNSSRSQLSSSQSLLAWMSWQPLLLLQSQQLFLNHGVRKPPQARKHMRYLLPCQPFSLWLSVISRNAALAAQATRTLAVNTWESPVTKFPD